MSMFVVYQTIPNEEIIQSAEDAIPQIEEFFVNNPERQECRTEVWYGEQVSIRRGHVREDVEAARDAAMKKPSTAEPKVDPVKEE